MERRQGLSVDSETTALVLKDNIQLSAKGADFTKSFLSDWCRASFPSLPSEGVESIVGHLTSSAVVTYVATNLGVEDLTMSAEFPIPDDVLHSTFMAVIGALQESSGAERAGFFLRVRCLVYCDMITHRLAQDSLRMPPQQHPELTFNLFPLCRISCSLS